MKSASTDDTNTAKEIIEQAIEQQESDADEIVEELSGELVEYMDCWRIDSDES